MEKPGRVFDRDREWRGLAAFAARGGAGPTGGATLGVVSGRRRQGKSFLLQGLTEATGGLYFAATEATEAESLRQFTAALARFTASVPEHPPHDWDSAIRLLFSSLGDRAVPVVIDEFPFLLRVSPELSSIIQRELGPGGSGEGSQVRLILCGSSMSVMGRLLAGHAPLRGRASLELVIRPFGYRDAARFWGITDPALAVLVHAIVGGTPAYRHQFTAGDAPDGVNDFDDWVVRTVLNPQTPLFREARYLLAEESDIRDPSLYHSVLAAIATGNSTNGRIASYVGRSSDMVTHPLNVLEDSALIARTPDLFRGGRTRYQICEPLISFYEAVMRPRWAELERDRGAAVWAAVRPTFLAQIVGPHFESLCREWALDTEAFGELPAEVGSGTVPDPERRTQIEIDVVVLAAQESGRPRRVLGLGEAKWGETMGAGHLARLERARDLLTRKGFDTSQTRLACYSGAGFTDDLRATPALLVGLDDLYPS